MADRSKQKTKTEAQKENDWWYKLEEAAKESIARGMQDEKEGRVTPHEEVMKKYSHWLTK